MVELGSGKKWFQSFSEIVSDMFLEEIENECDAFGVKMTFPERANEVERRMKNFVKYLHEKYIAEGEFE